jgi:pilus assembly protein CpaB
LGETFFKEMPLAINDTMGGPNRLRRAVEPTSRRSGTRAALFWAFTLVAGLGTALMIARYLDKRGGGATVTVAGVVVAAADLPLAAKLKLEDLKVIEWPADHLPPGAVSDPKELIGRVLVSRVLAQQPLLPGMLAAKNAGSGLAALIPSNMRAIAVRVDDIVGVAGFIHADDRVDVLVTMRPTFQGGESTTKAFLQNIKVLAVGQEIDMGDKSRMHATPAAVATLLVSPKDAERLVLAQTEGRIMLTLRSWTDSQAVDTDGASPSGLLGGGPVAQKEPSSGNSAPSHQVAVRRGRGGKDKGGPQQPTLAAEAPPPQKDTVEILRGDRFEQRNFNRGDKR